MNIFALSHDPKEAAQFMHDKHVVKMTLESAQLLCSALALNGATVPYKTTHKNHPSSIWARQSFGNWYWLYQHTYHLNEEFKYRFSGKDHASWLAVEPLLAKALIFLQGNADHTSPFAQAMPEKYRGIDAVTAYRRYYIGEKLTHVKNGQNLNYKWTRREIPQWIRSA